MSVMLRRMGRSDLAAISLMEENLFGEEAWSPGMLASELNSLSDRYYLAAEEDGQIVGYAGLLTPGSDQADVLTIAVARDRWGQGIGSALLLALLTEAERRDCAEVFLEVRVDNERAQSLYRRHGFAAVGLRRGYYQPSGADALVMRRLVRPARPDGEDDGGRPGQGSATRGRDATTRGQGAASRGQGAASRGQGATIRGRHRRGAG